MKKLIYIFAILFAVNAKAQSSEDSSLTVQLTQYFADYLLQEIPSTYENSRIIDSVKRYAGSGTRPDSLFTVRMRAKFLWPAINHMMTQPTVSGYAEFVKYILNQRIGATGAAITGYTALRTQILNKAGSTTDPDRFAAQWLSEQYQRRQADLEAVRDENRRINKERQPTTLIRN
jgi:hypothetical protein